ncbi:MAG TPA: hypothetical protein H9875_02050 [Candidatus Levilactobacillus faecigallinarum]|uniref:LPXTG cell wall anchor domain-containing protein n=1 Tax=Candidatus Levilactobacillus faecigallinarum TaxID=2838638 RepID=A0A9D1QQY4_9LACO|nr:hypothetical protein [Candidatus Levilactobacillus faecigallinarum]
MRLRKVMLLLLSLGLFGWGITTSANAASDLQQSQYEITLTPPNASSSSSVATGEANDLISGESSTGQGTTVKPTSSSGQSALVAGSQNATAAKPASGRLPQLSEQQWYLFGSLLGVILLLLFWVWKLSRKNRHS